MKRVLIFTAILTTDLTSICDSVCVERTVTGVDRQHGSTVCNKNMKIMTGYPTQIIHTTAVIFS
jgi:hypothetical protein